MTKEQFERALARLDFSQSGFGRTINRDARTVRRWVSGEHQVPTEIALLLNLMIRTKSSVKDLRA